jgi:voltage-gated potassium channel
VLLSIYGLAVLGYITATVASFFIGRDAEEKSGPLASAKEMSALLEEMRELRAELAAAGDIRERRAPAAD